MVKYILLFFLCSIQLSAQILDDSTHQIYSNKTVQYFYEKDLLNNIENPRNPDSLLKDFQFTDLNAAQNWAFQDLGNVGTAAKKMAFEPIYSVLQTIGYESFSLFAPKTDQFKYYNTKSPYTSLRYTQSGRGFTQFDFTHSQNFNKEWNFTLDVGKYNSSKQYDALSSEDRLVNHWNYKLYSNYISKNKKLVILAAFYNFNHLHNEQGGLKNPNNGSEMLSSDSLQKNYRRYYFSNFTNNVSSRERWNNLHLYQQYKLANGFQLFNILDHNRQKYFYTDPNLAINIASGAYNLNYIDTVKYKALIARTDTLRQNFLFKNVSDQFGLKGRIKGFDYTVYGLYRIYSFSNNIDASKGFKNVSQLFFGGKLGYYLKDSVNNLVVEGQFTPNFKNIFLDGKLNFYNFFFQANFSNRPAGLFYQQFNNSILSWNNDLKQIFQFQTKGAYTLKRKNLELRPGFTNTVISNFTFLNQKMLPEVKSKALNVLNIENTISYKFKKLFISNYSSYSIVSDSSVLHIPTFVSNTHFEYDFKYAKVLNLTIGLDLFYKSRYFGDAYSPMLQQYYLQNTNYIWGNANRRGYFVADPFVAFNIKKVKLALKYIHANQSIFGKGLYTSPNYLHTPSAFLLKVDWPLFD